MLSIERPSDRTPVHCPKQHSHPTDKISRATFSPRLLFPSHVPPRHPLRFAAARSHSPPMRLPRWREGRRWRPSVAATKSMGALAHLRPACVALGDLGTPTPHQPRALALPSDSEALRREGRRHIEWDGGEDAAPSAPSALLEALTHRRDLLAPLQAAGQQAGCTRWGAGPSAPVPSPTPVAAPPQGASHAVSIQGTGSPMQTIHGNTRPQQRTKGMAYEMGPPNPHVPGSSSTPSKDP
jgi:hypothetical protein